MPVRKYRKADEKGSVSVSAKFPKSVLRRIDKAARALKITRSHFIFAAVEAKLPK
jgi:hypothetical protein